MPAVTLVNQELHFFDKGAAALLVDSRNNGSQRNKLAVKYMATYRDFWMAKNAKNEARKVAICV